MNAVQIHLMLNHAPVLAPIMGALLLATALLFRSQAVLRVGLATVTLGALLAIPVYLTGEPVEDVVEKTAGVTDRQIDPHEDAAKVSLVLLEVLGAAALVTLIASQRRRLSPAAGIAALFLTLIVAGQVAWTAHLGGQIRHTELGGNAAGTTQDGGGNSGGGGEHEDDD